MQERLLAEKLIGYDTSTPRGSATARASSRAGSRRATSRTAALEVRDLPIVHRRGRPDRAAAVIVMHGHIDVVPGRDGQFDPRVEGDRLFGRGAYDMKGAAAAMMLALADLRDQHDVRVRLALVPDEETEEEFDRGTDVLVDAGLRRATSRSPASRPTC